MDGKYLLLSHLLIGKLKERHPLMFEFSRDKNEKTKVLYDQTSDLFFQFQETNNEGSLFLGNQIVKETRLFIATQLNPIFILLQVLTGS